MLKIINSLLVFNNVVVTSAINLLTCSIRFLLMVCVCTVQIVVLRADGFVRQAHCCMILLSEQHFTIS